MIRRKALVALLALAALLALPAAANATLSYTKGIQKPRVYVAEDNGKGARQVGVGPQLARLAGRRMGRLRTGIEGRHQRTAALPGGVHKSERLLNPWAESFVFAWSPDSTKVAAVTGGARGKRTLLVIDAKSLKREKVATGYFNGVSFSPESDELVYGVVPDRKHAEERHLPLRARWRGAEGADAWQEIGLPAVGAEGPDRLRRAGPHRRQAANRPRASSS